MTDSDEDDDDLWFLQPLSKMLHSGEFLTAIRTPKSCSDWSDYF
jgi:hypothetical protein